MEALALLNRNIIHTETEFINWMHVWVLDRRMRGIKIDERDYQYDKLLEVFREFFNHEGHKKFVLAASPNSGKTLMTIMFLDWCISHISNFRALVLTHGQTNLKNQFNKSAVMFKADFLKVNDSVIVDLPHSVHRKIESMGRFNLVVVDEAHQLYFADDGMVQNIIKTVDPDCELLLTGTPSEFIMRNIQDPGSYYISFIDLYTLHNLGYLHNDVLVEVASSTYDFGMDSDIKRHYNSAGELKRTTDTDRKGIFDTMRNVMDRLMSRLKTNPELYKNKLTRGITDLFPKTQVDKTMIVCRKISEAGYVREFLLEYGFTEDQILQSTTGEHDGDLDDFKYNDKIRVAIVVYRGILGFDYPELANVIDLTCSWNVNRIFQLYCRLVRKSDKIGVKFYYKIVPERHLDFFNEFMKAVLHLSHSHFLKMFNGSNFLDMPIKYKSDPMSKDKNVGEDNLIVHRGKNDVVHQKIMPAFGLDFIFDLKRLSHIGGSPCESKFYETLNSYMGHIKNVARIKWDTQTDDELFDIMKSYCK